MMNDNLLTCLLSENRGIADILLFQSILIPS